MDRRQAHCGQMRTAERPVRKRRTGRAADRAACAALSAIGRARLPAFHHGTCGSDRTPPLSSSSRASWSGTIERRALSVPCRSSAAGFTPQTGRSAGRAFWPRAAREPRLTRPKPAGTVLAPSRRRHPAVSFLGRDLILRNVSISGTFVKMAVTWIPPPPSSL